MPKPIEPALRGEFSTVVNIGELTASEKDGVPTEIPVLPKGEFMTLPYGNMVLDDGVFDQMIANFENQIRRAVPVDFDHAWENTRAAGWIKKLINKESGLWAEVKWNKKGTESVKDEEYKMISAEWSFDYVDPQKSTHHGAVLVAATLTNRPLMQSMPAITASETGLTNTGGIMVLLNRASTTNEKTMPTITEILQKPAAERTEEELKMLSEAEDLTDEQKTQLETEQAEQQEAEKQEAEEQAETEAKEGNVEACEKSLIKAGRTEAEAKTEAEKMVASFKSDDETVTVAASELQRLQKLEADHKASEALKAAEDFAQPFLRTSENKCRVLPAGKDALIKLSQSLNENQRNLLASVLKATTEVDVTGQVGEDDTDAKSATEQYDELVEKHMKAGKTPTEAARLVRKENPEVHKAFTLESK